MSTYTAIPSDTFDPTDGNDWEGGVAPTTGAHTLVFPPGHYVFTGGLTTARQFDAIITRPGAHFNFPNGSWYVSLDHISGTQKLLSIAGSGEMKIAAASGAGSGIDNVHVQGKTTLYLADGAFPSVVVADGSAELADACTVTASGKLYAMGGGITVHAHATDRVGALFAAAGTVLLRRDFISGDIGAARVILDEGATVSDGAGAGEVRMHHDMGVLDVRDAVTIDDIKGYAGLLDPSRSGGDVTLTDSTMGARFKAVEDWVGGALVRTNPSTKLGSPGSYYAGPGIPGNFS